MNQPRANQAILALMLPRKRAASTHQDAIMYREVIDVLRQFNEHVDPKEWIIDRFSKGSQATLFIVGARDQRELYQAHKTLVVKLYRSPASRLEAVREEFHALGRLRQAISGVNVSGWNLTAPEPLFLSRSPLALVLTRVQGIQLDQHLLLPAVMTNEFSQSVASAVISALFMYWADSSSVYGDINLKNILCDRPMRLLPFIDPGKPHPIYACDTVPKEFYPDSRDLAYLLFEVSATNARLSLVNPRARRRRNRFIQYVITLYVHEAQVLDRIDSIFVEIKACTRVHLDRINTLSFPRNLWCLYVRYHASRNIDAILSAIRAQVVSDAT